jgi:heme/copper-type cytochrome/quinol oxidase subunit 2
MVGYLRRFLLFDRTEREAYMRSAFAGVKPMVGVLALATAMLSPGSPSRAQQATTVDISVKGHHFEPAEIHAPANRPVIIRVKNLDAAAMEFESVSLRVEKVVAAGTQGVVNVRPLAPGRYEFFDDFHQETRGTLVVQ